MQMNIKAFSALLNFLESSGCYLNISFSETALENESALVVEL